jgi:hypothetical protein
MNRSATKRSGLQLVVSVAATVALLIAPAATTGAQGTVSDSTCTYSRCGLSIVPRLGGLDVVRGESEVRIGSLPFLWARDVSIAFSHDAGARSYAVRASGLRRIAAVMTDAGAFLIAAGAVGILHDGGRIRGVSSVAAMGGFALVGASVPVHFSADADLSRAVWRYNATLVARERDR